RFALLCLAVSLQTPLNRIMLSVLLVPPIFTLFPYTTLFRSREVAPECKATLELGPLASEKFFVSIQRPDGTEVAAGAMPVDASRSEEHTSELQSRENLVCRLLLEKKNDGFAARPVYWFYDTQ